MAIQLIGKSLCWFSSVFLLSIHIIFDNKTRLKENVEMERILLGIIINSIYV